MRNLLQPWTEHQPTSVVVNAVRVLTLCESGEQILDASTTGLVLQAIAWIVGIVLVSAPLAVRRSRRVA